MFCSLSSEFYFIGDKIAADCFKDETTPSLQSKDRLKFNQDVALNHIREKLKLQSKLSFRLLKEEDVYDPLLYISTYPTLIHLKFYHDGIQHYVTVVGKLIFDSNFPFELPLKKDNLDYYCVNDNETK